MTHKITSNLTSCKGSEHNHIVPHYISTSQLWPCWKNEHKNTLRQQKIHSF